ncbi:CB1 cannabinoid receptor-interacting protein 1-like [Haliotis rufescens]|uniref:CB1 cannabinoid receptor-interacting protein 1-like n=1 Tax=Haliotis rufescens TaxID=6454 RepID=UPI001EB00E1C|nr:CB1 cannabinoid receptor-interacting protein 1-like [Haliotis rufescens]
MASNFKVFLAFTKQPKDEPVYQKQDGQRFSVCNTIKLNVNSTYTVSVVIRPQRTLLRLQIQGENLGLNQVKPERDDDDSCKYQASWVTVGFEQSKSAERKELPVVLEMSNGVYMKLALQCKFYPEEETQHCHWGQPLHNIEYECNVPDGCTYVDITSTKLL